MSKTIEETVDREILRHACATAITYPQCGHITDVRDAALVSYTLSDAGLAKYGVDRAQYVVLFHTKCANIDGVAAATAERADEGLVSEYEIIDGRKL